ncbi:MAG TPA: hypothetical protein VE861_07595, partial [Gemmatimonadaceae bacterium]|nr:hypothetical protein [Gemmatimonadaceae bacterium]
RHLKRWTLAGMMRADLFDRAIPWMHLLRDRSSVVEDGALNTGRTDKLLTVAAGLAGLCTVLALVTQRSVWLVGAAACLAAITIASLPLLAWFARVRGTAFALAVLPLRWLFYGECALAAALVLLSPRPRSAEQPVQRTRTAARPEHAEQSA